MAGTTITMSKVKQILRLKSDGAGLQTIAKAVGISRNTVKKYVRLVEVKGYKIAELLDKEAEQIEALLSDPDQVSTQRYESLVALFPYMSKELKRVGVTRWILWGEYKDKHPDGYSYAHFCRYFRHWQTTGNATMHFEHSPADKVYIDFAGKKLQWVDNSTGAVHQVEVFLAILGYSQLTYIEAVATQKKEGFISATENAFHYFKGVPKVLVPDNLKSAVTKPGKYEADINTDFADFANHYSTTVMPARSYKPRDKSLAENAVRIAYSRIYAPLRNQLFYSLEDINSAIKGLLETHNNQPFQKQEQSRREKFEQQEKDHLLPLATERYQIKKFKHVTVMKNCHIHLSDDKHYYSVPYQYIGKKVKLVYSQSNVAAFYNKQRIAFYKRDTKYFGYTTTKEHLPSSHQFVSDWNPEKFLGWAAGIDPKVKAYINAILQSKAYPEQAYRSCVGILSLEKKVGKQRLIAAIERATHYGAYNYKIIDRILKGGLDRLKNDTPSNQASLPFHDNIRGPEDYQ